MMYTDGFGSGVLGSFGKGHGDNLERGYGVVYGNWAGGGNGFGHGNMFGGGTGSNSEYTLESSYIVRLLVDGAELEYYVYQVRTLGGWR
jgi:hypothetical protein